MARWLWESRSIGARAARAALWLPAAFYGALMRVRATAYRSGWLATRPLPAPAVSVGNLSVGGTGKTPLAGWIAAYVGRRGRRPAVLLRGYGGDEHLVHERAGAAIVIADPDRVAGAGKALAQGADFLILDDGFQRLDVARDLNVALVAAESVRAAPWPLPAGPWRERWDALARAHVIVVTRKRALAADAHRLAAQLGERYPGTPVAVAHLRLGGLEGLHSGVGLTVPLESLARRRVVAAAGIADPVSFAVQLRALGTTVQLAAFEDHHAFTAADVAGLVRAAGEADYLIVTEKDAVKLRHLWPHDGREPLVAVLTVDWEENGQALPKALEALLARPVSLPLTSTGIADDQP